MIGPTTLAAGESYPLSSAMDTNPANTTWEQFESGEYSFYTFVDSFDADDNPYVEIFEINELDNQSGPQVVTLSAGSVFENAAAAELISPPPRSDAGQ